MKKKFLLPVLIATALFGACKKGDVATPAAATTTTTPVTAIDVATENTIAIADNINSTVKYDDKTITAKSFDLEKILVYIYPASQQITLQSKDKDGIFFKYNVGLNMPMTTDKVGVKQNCVPTTTPLVGINIYDAGTLYYYSCMNGTYTIEAMDAHNITILFSAMDFKQSLMTGFDAGLKRFSTKPFRIKGTY